MFIKNYGLFWRCDEVDWKPGSGVKGAFRLLGRRGKNRPNIRLADFRRQKGIYILYGNHGPHYVGLTKEMGLGRRLSDHLNDRHSEEWDRFSWFGFREVLGQKDSDGLCKLKDIPKAVFSNPAKLISDIEALLIRAMGLDNINQMNFSAAKQWRQIKKHEVEHYMDKVS